jgi:hypothetical protein
MPRTKAVEDVVLSEEEAGPLVKIDDKNLELDTAFDTAIEQAREEIHRIDERAEFAISVVTQAIRTQATVAKGRVLLQLRERFDQVPQLDGKWVEFLNSEDITQQAANGWMNAARAVNENSLQYGEDFLMGFSATALAKVQTLPAVIKEAVLETAVEEDKVPTLKEVEAVGKKPATKLAKALEQLELNALKQVEAENSEDSYPEERYKLRQQEKKLQETIEQLKSQIAEDKIKREQQEKEAERLNAELDLLKYDDAAAREQRVKRVASSLIVSLPAVLSDLQKYVAEKDHYESKHVKSIDSSIDTLINFLKPLYA